MGRPLRHGLAGHLVEITCRTVHGRFLLRPSSAVNVAILGVLGRAQRYYGLRVCAVVFMSNHYHLLVIPDSEEQLSRFMQFVDSNLARQLGRFHNWREKFWSREYKPVAISHEPEAQISRVRYLLEHGVKEHLVERPQDWPGVHSVHELLTGGRFLRGMWHERTLENKVRRSGGAADQTFRRRDFWTAETVELSSVPALEGLSVEERRRFFRNMVRDIVAGWREQRQETGRSVLGAKIVRRQDPHDQPLHMKRSRAPLVHAHSPDVRREMIERYRAFVAVYRRASELFRAGLPAEFPEGCFPPAGPFVPYSRAGPLAEPTPI